MEPTTGHLMWVVAALLFSTAALLLCLLDLRATSLLLRRVGRLLALLAVLICLGLVSWRNLFWQESMTCPIENNFDAGVLFTALLGGMMFYMIVMDRRRAAAAGRPPRSVVDLLFLPLMVGSLAFGLFIHVAGRFHESVFDEPWLPTHMTALVIAVLCMVYAAVAGAMYLLVDRALRRRSSGGLVAAMPSLERLESALHHSVLWGFLLLTLVMVTGLFLAVNSLGYRFLYMMTVPKVWVATAAWVVYAFVLNARVMPRFRGRRAAWFSIAGLALLLLTYLIVRLVPLGGF